MSKYWGKGYATEVGKLLLGFGFVMEKIGMTYEGRLRQTMLIRDGWLDSDVYSIVEDERREN